MTRSSRTQSPSTLTRSKYTDWLKIYMCVRPSHIVVQPLTALRIKLQFFMITLHFIQLSLLSSGRKIPVKWHDLMARSLDEWCKVLFLPQKHSTGNGWSLGCSFIISVHHADCNVHAWSLHQIEVGSILRPLWHYNCVTTRPIAVPRPPPTHTRHIEADHISMTTLTILGPGSD